MSTNNLNELIQIFLDHNVNQLRIDEIDYSHDIIRSFGSSLFQIDANQEYISLEPKMNICRDFLDGKCSFKSNDCPQFHICRYFGQCRKRNCRFPHQLNKQNNQGILKKWNCENIDQTLLIRLIQLYNRCSNQRFQIPKPLTNQSKTRIIERSSPTDTTNLIDMSILDSSHVTIESIKEYLKIQGFQINRIFNPIKTNDFQRWTLQFQDPTVNKHLAKKAILPYKNTYLKFKQINPIIDSKSFILQTTIDRNKGPISIQNFSNYINILVNRNSYKLTDLSSSSEQILLIECDQIVSDFSQLRRLQKSRRQLRGRDINLKQIYEYDLVHISSKENFLTSNLIQTMIKPVHSLIFTFHVLSNDKACIEFVNHDALKQWLINSNLFEQKYEIHIQPNIKYVDEDKLTTTTTPTPTPTISDSIIYFGKRRALLFHHPKFSQEYKTYIYSELGLNVEIHDKQIRLCQMNASGNEHLINQLRIRTNSFIKQFVFQTKNLQNPNQQLEILRKYSSIVAYQKQSNNTYILVLKHSDVNELTKKLSVALQVSPSIDKTIVLPNQNKIQLVLFSNKSFEKSLQDYFLQSYQTKFSIEVSKDDNERYLAKLNGEEQNIGETIGELLNIISLFRMKKFNETSDLNWIEITDAVRVIQYQLNIRMIICVCQQETSPFSIVVYYIDEKHGKFGVNESLIEKLCRNELMFSECKPVKINEDWVKLKSNILKRFDYGNDICLFENNQTITLYGLPNIVKNLEQQFRTINNNVIRDTYPRKQPTNLNRTLSKNSLLVNDSIQQRLKIFSPQQTSKFNQEPLKYKIEFQIDEPGFEVFIQSNHQQILDIVNSKCSLNYQILHQPMQIQIPQAKVQKAEDNSQSENTDTNPQTKQASNWFFDLFSWTTPKTEPPKSSTSSSTSPSIPIGKSKILVCIGDLAQQTVDLIVVCSTSTILCDTITSAAGTTVKSISKRNLSCDILTFDSPGGNLPCKRIFFHPFSYERNYFQTLKQLIDSFVSSAITYAIQNNLSTIAFPSIGCGQLGHDPKQIAEYMLTETYQQLKAHSQLSLTISFVLLPTQKSVYDAFVDQLQTLDNKPTYLSFDRQIIKVTLIGTDQNFLTTCKNQIETLARTCSHKVHLIDQTDLATWPQTTIHKYYEFCLQKRVLPTIDINRSIIDLIGPRDAISDVEKYYYQLTTETLRNTRTISSNDSSLPSNWLITNENFKRVSLSYSSNEYQDILNCFHITMKNSYSKILSIERIQNKRWYKQYAIHREEFRQRYKQLDERRLFHGCNRISTEKIIVEGFNRSFAGVNGTVYGVGVYFHEYAKYSHNFARADSYGIRTMFLADVLIGKTCLGNSSMKVPPDGFDTTSDGQHIFVVYHDAAAYGHYLITYQSTT